MLGFALRTLYATMKSKMLIGFIGAEWESKVVAELDSSMNKWKDSLPDFCKSLAFKPLIMLLNCLCLVRWNPENPDTTLLCQSITLYTCFYHLQIQIHRPFLMKRSPLSFTSFAMCTSAARSTAHVLEVAMSRGAVLFTGSYVSVHSLDCRHLGLFYFIVRWRLLLLLLSCCLSIKQIRLLIQKRKWSLCKSFSSLSKRVKERLIFLDDLCTWYT